MNKLNFPSLSIKYYDLKVYNIVTSPDITSNSVVTIVAPDSYVALSVFSGVFPERDILNVTCVGPCISVFPSL